MPSDTTQLQSAASVDVAAMSRWAWPLVLLAVLVAWLLTIYSGTLNAVVDIWMRSETYAHGWLIVPISTYLIWRQREHLLPMTPRPQAWPLVLLLLLGAAWLLGDVAAVGVVQQYAVVAMLPVLVWTILGGRVAREIAFALAFLLLAVPVGESLVPPLMRFTADFTVASIRLIGIPVYREGLYITLPSGNWSVVEACSGLRYLIASVTLGLIYAYLTYRRWSRRLLFIGASIVVPVLANGVRAFMIVMIGHLSNMTLAVSVDHLIYGWLFFGLVMLGLFWVGALWREDLLPESPRPAEQQSVSVAPRSHAIAIALAAAALIGLWPVLAAKLAGGATLPDQFVLPDDIAEWRTSEQLPPLQPKYTEPRLAAHRGYTSGAAPVFMYVGYYRNQTTEHRLVSSINVLVDDAKDNPWRAAEQGRRTVRIGTTDIEVERIILRDLGRRTLVTWQWYWVAGKHTGSPYLAKLYQAESMLLGRGDGGAKILVYSMLGDEPQAAAEEQLAAFVASAAARLEPALNDVNTR